MTCHFLLYKDAPAPEEPEQPVASTSTTQDGEKVKKVFIISFISLHGGNNRMCLGDEHNLVGGFPGGIGGDDQEAAEGG